MNLDPTTIRFQQMVEAREVCLRKLRGFYGHIPAPVVGMISELAETVVRIALTPDDELEAAEPTEDTAVWRRS